MEEKDPIDLPDITYEERKRPLAITLFAALLLLIRFVEWLTFGYVYSINSPLWETGVFYIPLSLLAVFSIVQLYRRKFFYIHVVAFITIVNILLDWHFTGKPNWYFPLLNSLFILTVYYYKSWYNKPK